MCEMSLIGSKIGLEVNCVHGPRQTLSYYNKHLHVPHVQLEKIILTRTELSKIPQTATEEVASSVVNKQSCNFQRDGLLSLPLFFFYYYCLFLSDYSLIFSKYVWLLATQTQRKG